MARKGYTIAFASPALFAIASVSCLFFSAYVRRPYYFSSIKNLDKALGHSIRGRVIEVNGLELKVLNTPHLARFFKSSSQVVKIEPIGVDFI